MKESDLFLTALEIDSPEKRAAYLDSVCGENESLRQRLEQLLRSHQEVGSLLEHPALEAVATELVSEDKEAPRPASGDTVADMESQTLEFLSPSDNPDALGQLGQYEILEVVGRGGMGIVLRGADPKLNRVVAIKVLSPEFAANPSAHKRFLREAQAAAAVSHDHIVTIYAVEETPVPHLVMEYIDGKSLQQKIDEEGQLEVKEILRIARQVAAGLAAAHAQGLTHRDIKPSNILLQNGIQRVQITDFGLARATADANITRTGEIAGTPQYMSPEQAKSETVDQRSDLFSLGSLMYAMCSGRSPFRAETPYGAIKRVCEDEPRSLRENNPEISPWLEAIIFKLLEKNPDHRFRTAQEVADLLEKHLSHLQDPGSTPFPGTLLVARPSRRKLAHPRILAAAALMLLAVVALGFTEAAGVTHFRGTVIRLATGEGTLVIEVDDPSVQVTLDGEDLSISGQGFQELKLRPGHYEFQATKDGRPVKTELVSIERGGRRVVKVTRESAARAIEAPRRSTGLTSTSGETISELRQLSGGHAKPITDLAFSSDGRHLVSTAVGSPALLWEVESGKQVRSYTSLKQTKLSVAVTPDGSRIVAPTTQIAVWDLETANEVIRFRDESGYVNSLAVSPDGLQIATVSAEGDLRIWDLKSGDELWKLHLAYTAFSVVYSPDGKLLLVTTRTDRNSLAGRVCLIDVATRRILRTFGETERAIYAVAFSADGRRAVTGQGVNGQGVVQVWEMPSGKEVCRLSGHTGRVEFVSFLPDGEHVVSGSEDKTLRLWNIESGSELAQVRGDGHFFHHGAVSPDGRTIATAGGIYWESGEQLTDGDYAIRLWQLPESVWPENLTSQSTGDSDKSSATTERINPEVLNSRSEVADYAHQLAAEGRDEEARFAFQQADRLPLEEGQDGPYITFYLQFLNLLAGDHSNLEQSFAEVESILSQKEHWTTLDCSNASLGLIWSQLGPESPQPSSAFLERLQRIRTHPEEFFKGDDLSLVQEAPWWKDISGLGLKMAFYQQGEFQKSLTFEYAEKMWSPQNRALSLLFEAMAQAQLGELETARQAYEAAIKLQKTGVPPVNATVFDRSQFQPLWFLWRRFEYVRKEAEETLRQKGALPLQDSETP